MHSLIDSTAHSRPLNRLGHETICILCTTSMTNLPPTWMQTQYLCVSSHKWTESAIGAGNIILSAACISYRMCFNKKTQKNTSLYIPLPGSLRDPAGTLAMCWRCPPDIPYTLRPPAGSRDEYLRATGRPR